MSDRDEKSRWDYLGRKVEVEKDQDTEKGLNYGEKLLTQPEDYIREQLWEIYVARATILGEGIIDPQQLEEYTREQIWEIYERLPEDLKDAIFSEKTADINYNLKQKYGLSEALISKIAKWEGSVLLGILPPEEFKKRLKKDLGINPEVSETLFREVYKLIFDPVKESLNKLYST